MEPYLFQGEHVLTFNWAKVKKGDVIVFKRNKTFFVKRIVKVDNNQVRVEGDNKKLSLKMGLFYRNKIVGKVIAKY